MNVSTKWFEDKGDETVALNWPIGPESLVWEIGGFEGRWARQMVDKFHCKMEIFEPQLWAVQRMEEKFKGLPNIQIHPFGLWVMDDHLSMFKYETDGCSILGEGETGLRATFVDVWGWRFERPDVDVCLMNIEGSEFFLLPYMIGMGMMKHFQYFWCQFHPGLVSHGNERYNEIYKGLSRTHDKIWDYYPTAVAWERK